MLNKNQVGTYIMIIYKIYNIDVFKNLNQFITHIIKNRIKWLSYHLYEDISQLNFKVYTFHLDTKNIFET